MLSIERALLRFTCGQALLLCRPSLESCTGAGTVPRAREWASQRAGRAHALAQCDISPDKRVIIEAKGSGVCLLDFDHDGWFDIYLGNGSTMDALAGKAMQPSSLKRARV
jgi:hypothetical protein